MRKALVTALGEMGVDLAAELPKHGYRYSNSMEQLPTGTKRAVVLTDDADFDITSATRTAIGILSLNPKGFFLMVESDLHVQRDRISLAGFVPAKQDVMLPQSVTNQEIQKWVFQHHGLKIETYWIAHCKELCGLTAAAADSRRDWQMCPPEVQPAIKQAFRYFGMLQNHEQPVIMDMTDPGGREYVGSSRTELSLETVQEFQVVNAGLSAETGGASGGSINVITRVGANIFHGDAFLFVQNVPCTAAHLL